MIAKDPDRWEETDEPGVYRRRQIVEPEPSPAPQKSTMPPKPTMPSIKPHPEPIRYRSPEEVQVEINATSSALDLAAQHDIDLSAITGTGKDGRITRADVEAALAE